MDTAHAWHADSDAAGGAGAAAWVGIAAALKLFPATLGSVYALSGRMGALVAMAASAAILTLAGALAEPAATVDFVRRVGLSLRSTVVWRRTTSLWKR